MRSAPGASGLALAAFLTGCAAGEVAPPAAPPPPRPAPAVAVPLANPPAQPAPIAPPEAAAPGEESRAEPAPAGPAAAAPAPGPRSEPAPDPPLGWVAGTPLEPEELLLEWGDVASRELYLVVDKLISARLALAEAARLGIKLDPGAVEERASAERAELEERVAKDKKQRTLDEYIRRELGFEPERYLERLRLATIRQMLAERSVRANSLQNETLSLRLIVVSSTERAAEARAALDGGRDFAEVAREFSIDDSKEDGGLVPFVVPQERSPLARLAFQTDVGAVAGPVPIADHHFLIRVEERRTPLLGDWNAIEAAVEASLRAHPVQDSEFLHWKLVMEGRYPIDLGPLWSLIGAAR